VSAGDEVDTGLVDALLALSTQERQTYFLRASGLLDADGLDRLLDFADHLLGSDPGKARRLAEACVAMAEAAAAPAAVPRANYIRAGAHNINGEFEEDLRLTRAAHDGYAALGINLEALRTNVGKMAALLELGRYEEALDAGRVVLDALDGEGDLEVAPTPEETGLLIAFVHGNRGGCYEYMGRYEEALQAYAIAEERFESLGMTERLGEILGNRGAILLQLGRGDEALSAYEAVADISEKAGLTISRAKALVNIGEAHLRLGNYALSLDAFEQTRRLLEPLGALADKHLFLRDTANAYLALNLYSEALVAYQEAEGLLRAAGMVHDQAQALWGMGSALIARSELEKAGEALAGAAVLFEEAGNVPLLSGVILEQASLFEARGDHEAAITTASRALDLVSGNEWPVQLVYAHLRLADLRLADPLPAAAEPHLLEARRLVERLALPQLRFRLNERLGRLRRMQGRDEEARVLLEAAVEEIERLRGTVTQDSMRASFLRDKTAAYEDLLRLYLATEDENGIRRAFAVAERAKSRALVDLLTGVAEAGPAMSTDFELEGRIRASRADLNAVYNEMLGGYDDAEHRMSLPDLRTRAVELEGEISRLRLHAATGSAPDPFVASVPPSTIQDTFPSDVMLLAYHAVGDEIVAFVGRCGHVRVARGVGTVSSVQRLLQKLAVQWERFRAGQEFTRRHMTLLERSARQVLTALHGELVAPLEPLLEEAVSAVGDPGASSKLVVVPHGPLHQVPFHALFDGERHFIERFEVAYAPSATVYALCQEREPRDPGRALVFGVEDPLTPAAVVEALAVADRLPEAEVRVGEEATMAALRAEAPGRGSLHLACHGLFRADNPMFSSLKLQDGWLTAADVMSLDLDGALVVLSACESGRNEVVEGDEILGLTRAFLRAGAATLVVSLWLVQDETTAELMGIWYERLRKGEGRAASLRAAQLEIKARYPHPYYWAPFVLTGKR